MSAEEIARILDELAARLGPAGQYAYELALRQVYIQAAIGTGLLIASLVACAVFLPRIYRWGKSGTGGYSTRDVEAVLMGAGPVLLTSLAVLNFVVYVIPLLLNPEYAALRDLLRTIK